MRKSNSYLLFYFVITSERNNVLLESTTGYFRVLCGLHVKRKSKSKSSHKQKIIASLQHESIIILDPAACEKGSIIPFTVFMHRYLHKHYGNLLLLHLSYMWFTYYCGVLGLLLY